MLREGLVEITEEFQVAITTRELSSPQQQSRQGEQELGIAAVPTEKSVCRQNQKQLKQVSTNDFWDQYAPRMEEEGLIIKGDL